MREPCPLCGSERPLRVHEIVGRIPFSILQQRIAYVLADRFMQFVPSNSIIDAIYFDDPNGGPDSATACLRSHIMQARKKLRKTGLEIESSGRAHNGYRMIWRDDART